MGIAPTRACGEDEAPSALVLAWYRAAAVSGDLQGGWGLGHCLRGEVHGLQLGGGLRAGVEQAPFGCRCPSAVCSLIDLLTCKKCASCHASLLGKRHSQDRFCPKCCSSSQLPRKQQEPGTTLLRGTSV